MYKQKRIFSVVFFLFPQASVPLTRLADHSRKNNWITFNVSSLTLYQAIDQKHMDSHGQRQLIKSLLNGI